MPSDVDALLHRLKGLTQTDVFQLNVSGQIDLACHRRLDEAIGRANGRARTLLCDLSELRFEPTSEDIAALNADGYLGEVVSELRTAQNGPAAEVAKDSLALLAGLLDERKAKAAAGGAP